MRLSEAGASDISNDARRLELKAFFSRPSSRRGGVHSPTAYSWAFHDLMSFIDVEERSVLDVGCGAGNLAISAAARGANTFASDVNPDAVELTKKNSASLGLDVAAKISDGLSIWKADNFKFDVVLCNPPSLHLLSSELDIKSQDPNSNSALIIDVIENYRSILSEKGCLISAVSGAENISWVSSFLLHRSSILPFVCNKHIPVEGIQSLNMRHLVDSKIIIESNKTWCWDAYFFAVFHY